MPQSQQQIKSRIASVQSTQKITNAMQLVAGSKLNKMRKLLEANREYYQSLREILAKTITYTDRYNIFLQKQPGPAFIFVLSSDMGLCGAYNANIYKMLKQYYRPEDLLVMAGSRGIAWARSNGFSLYAGLANLNEDTAYMDLSSLMDQAIALYEKGEIGSIQCIYTRYVNPITFSPEIQQILPMMELESESHVLSQGTLFEPKRVSLLKKMIPMVCKSELYEDYLESKVSEMASRRSAMESATDNAQELLEDLSLEANRLRQSAITQEITEIVSGSNALAG